MLLGSAALHGVLALALVAPATTSLPRFDVVIGLASLDAPEQATKQKTTLPDMPETAELTSRAVPMVARPETVTAPPLPLEEPLATALARPPLPTIADLPPPVAAQPPPRTPRPKLHQPAATRHELLEAPAEVEAPPSVASQANVGAKVDVLPTKLADNAPPTYPPESLARGEHGTVKLKITITASGTVEDISVHQSSGYTALDRAALEAVRQWRFAPARRGTTPVPFTCICPVEFVLPR
ncbi:MAG: energy transducer TonB [Gemmataceae bacterium]|nr:energy transducer TonB [Gemmataceae bacterium]